MAKGQQKCNREIRKPKSTKPKEPVAQASSFLTRSGAGVVTKPAGKKSR